MIREIADEVAAVMRANKWTRDVNFDWEEPTKVIRLDHRPEPRARARHLDAGTVGNFLNTVLSGQAVTAYRERDKQIDVIVRGAREERAFVSLLQDLAVPVGRGRTRAARADRQYHLRLRAGRVLAPQPAAGDHRALGPEGRHPGARGEPAGRTRSSNRSARRCRSATASTTGGAIEDAGKGQRSIAIVAPVMVFVMVTALMLQLQSFSRLATGAAHRAAGTHRRGRGAAPLQRALRLRRHAGHHRARGHDHAQLRDPRGPDRPRHPRGLRPCDAIVDSTVRRFRPIMLTAAAAVLAMIPLTRSAFYGPMAVAIMGGLVVATGLTLLFLPALYAAWFR